MNEEELDNLPSISPKVQQQIQKLIADDAAQQSRNYAYYEKIAKENPKLYRDPQTHRQMAEDIRALGDRFLPEEE